MKKSLIQFIIIIPLSLLLCLAFSCQKQGEGVVEEAVPAVDIEAEKLMVKSVLDKYVEAWKTEDIEKFSVIFAPDEDLVIFVSDSSERYLGWETWKEKIQGYIDAIQDVNVSFRNEFIKVHSSGNIAWISCIEDADWLEEDKLVSIKGGRATWILEKRNDNWVIVHSHWSVVPE